MTKLALTPLFMLMFPPVIPTTPIPLPCSTNLMTSLFTTWPTWPPSPHPSGPLVQVTFVEKSVEVLLYLGGPVGNRFQIGSVIVGMDP